MESTGVSGRIQVSSRTAGILERDGKGHLLVPRDDEVSAKGKGQMRTFFIKGSIRSSPSSTTSSISSRDYPRDVAPTEFALGQNDRLVTWLVSMLVADIKKLVSIIRAVAIPLF
jgi:Adenylate and Guanylate cyclase catalytic domain